MCPLPNPIPTNKPNVEPKRPPRLGLELKSRKGGKVEKGGKRREKVEKVDLVMQLAFWQTCQNAIKCHEMISVHPMLNM